MSPSASLRAEAALLRQAPKNNLSFLYLDDRCRTRLRVPEVNPHSVMDGHMAGVSMALELVAAIQASPRGASLHMILHKLMPALADVSLRNGFFDMLELAIRESLRPSELAAIEHAAEGRMLNATPTVQEMTMRCLAAA